MDRWVSFRGMEIWCIIRKKGNSEEMSSHHTKKAILTHYEQVEQARLHKAERQQQKKEAFVATRHAIRLQVAYYNLAQVGFIMMWVTVAAVLAIFALRRFW